MHKFIQQPNHPYISRMILGFLLVSLPLFLFFVCIVCGMMRLLCFIKCGLRMFYWRLCSVKWCCYRLFGCCCFLLLSLLLFICYVQFVPVILSFLFHMLHISLFFFCSFSCWMLMTLWVTVEFFLGKHGYGDNSSYI